MQRGVRIGRTQIKSTQTRSGLRAGRRRRKCYRTARRPQESNVTGRSEARAKQATDTDQREAGAGRGPSPLTGALPRWRKREEATGECGVAERPRARCCCCCCAPGPGRISVIFPNSEHSKHRPSLFGDGLTGGAPVVPSTPCSLSRPMAARRVRGRCRSRATRGITREWKLRWGGEARAQAPASDPRPTQVLHAGQGEGNVHWESGPAVGTPRPPRAWTRSYSPGVRVHSGYSSLQAGRCLQMVPPYIDWHAIGHVILGSVWYASFSSSSSKETTIYLFL